MISFHIEMVHCLNYWDYSLLCIEWVFTGEMDYTLELVLMHYDRGGEAEVPETG